MGALRTLILAMVFHCRVTAAGNTSQQHQPVTPVSAYASATLTTQEIHVD